MILLSNIIKQESSISPQKEKRKLSIQEVRIDHSHLLQAEENPEALMARVKEEADRISEQANSHIENIRRQIEQEKNDWAAEKQKLAYRKTKSSHSHDFLGVRCVSFCL